MYTSSIKANLPIAWLCLLFTTLNCSLLFAQTTPKSLIHLSPGFEIIDLTAAQITWLPDARHQLTFQDILSPAYQQKFKNIPRLHWGYDRQTHWLKICLRPNQRLNQALVLELFTRIEQVTFFYQQNTNKTSQWVAKKAGVVNGEFDRKSLALFNTNLPFVPNNQADITTIYVKLHSSTTATIFRFKLYEADYYNHYLIEQNIISALLYGAVLALIIYNLFLFFALREVTYLLYVVLEVLNVLIMLVVSGHFVSIFPAPDFWWFSLDQLLFLAIFVNSIFAVYFLDTSQQCMLSHKGVWAIGAVALGLFVLGGWFHWMPVAMAFSFVCAVLFIVNAIYLYFNGVKVAYYYLIAWIFYAVGYWIKALQVFDFIPSDHYLIHQAPSIGIALQVLFFSFALGDKINQIKKDRYEAQGELLLKTQENEQLVVSQKEVLEQKVAERTYQLEESYEEVQQQNQALKQARQKLENQQRLIQQQNQDLQQSTQKLKQLNHTKDRFFGIIAHDLRGPLASFQEVNNLIHYYLDKNKPERIKKLGHQIHQSAKSLNNLLNNLLNWALVQQKLVSYNPEPLNLRAMVEDCLNNFKTLLAIHYIQIKLSLGNDGQVWADKPSTSSMVHNLISNAVKFTPDKGTIHISIESSHDQVTLIVQDSGMGMNQATLDQVLGAGEVQSQQGVRGEKGSGLGLTLCREFAQFNQCQLTAESTLGTGTTFYLSFVKNNASLV
ncbi:7TM diverse intracellular signaling domain-containing protein [uncultured Microscilla sp.]|uniref:7TM diverse intracellular signaling domain-containing protein n=1 Tax=uncultured Microscilla sp. TaxID=432653 RepID=UPI00262EDA5C|nr:7TM diverse intracellular signaling domain-containing protein [uncultured Microscilla sp.]